MVVFNNEKFAETEKEYMDSVWNNTPCSGACKVRNHITFLLNKYGRKIAVISAAVSILPYIYKK